MRIAVCVSGLCRGNALDNISKLKQVLPYDFYFGTWETTQTVESKQLNAMVFEEPIMHYHPLCDIADFENERYTHFRNLYCHDTPEISEMLKNHTKQIIAHAYMMKNLKDNYDIIIRTRYDVLISNQVDFSMYIEKSFTKQCAVGFSTLWKPHNNKIDILEEIKKDSRDSKWFSYLLDLLIIHPPQLFDVNYVFELHNQKQLRNAEYGWYQILSEPYDDNHICVAGGIQIDKSGKQ